MTPSSSSPGICPRCERLGTAGAPCKRRACRVAGYHAIPLPLADGLADGAPADELLGRRVGDYLVASVLGSGGLGTVYLGWEPAIGQRVALKLLDLDQDGELTDAVRDLALRQFREEAAALARLTHPNIVRLVRYGEADGRPYVAMEYVEDAQTLGDLLHAASVSHRWPARSELLRILDEMLDALEAAHTAGIVHRDIKPDNVLLQPVPGRPPLVRLVDFGVAALLEDLRPTGFVVGTPEYLAPEQLYDRGLGPWTDVYAAATLACELLTGVQLFPGPEPEGIFQLKEDKAYDPLTPILGRGYPEPFLAVFRRALARRPEDRFRTVAAFRKALHEALADPALSAPGEAAPAAAADADASHKAWAARERERLAARRARLDDAARREDPTDRERDALTEVQGPRVEPEK